MPIPQISKSNKKQTWRKNRKKYYITRDKTGTRKSRVVQKKFSFSKRKKFSFWSFLLHKNVISTLLISFVLLLIFSFSFIAWLSKDLPDPNKLIDREVAQSTTIYDRTGETILYEIHGDEKRTLVNINELPEYIKWATISVEDKDFYKHKGFSVWAMFRTAVTNVLRGKKAGGSTLTQQFIKNAVLTPEKTYTRKIKELLLARKLEKKFEKNEILQMYLNEIPYGSTAYGVEAASQRYFGKKAIDIKLAEAAILAALPQAPSRYSPYGPNRELLITRQHHILDLMVEQGYTTEPKAEAAKLYKLEFKKPIEKIIAPHFVMYVKGILSEKYGEKMIEQAGLKIYTTLDLFKQKIAEETITEWVEKNKDYEATNAALVSIDPKNGQILTMVGSKDYFDEEIDGQVNIATSKRQPGSSLKPLVYATAFEKGYTPNTVLFDVITNFSNDDSEPYEPHNYDSKEHGLVTIRKALAGSLNIPAVKALYLADVKNVLNKTKELGYTTLNDRDRFGLSLVLGGGEVKLLEHVNAFGVFAREGIINPISAILKIEDKNGKIIEEFEKKETKVIDSKIARMINDVLSDNEARAYAFGERNWLTLGNRPVAAKTGTTNDYRDAWTIGYTPSIVAGVWVGNNDNTPMKRGAAGGTVAAPIWHDFMKKILGETPVENFKKTEEIKTGKPVLDGNTEIGTIVKIDKASGLLATKDTPESQIEEKLFKQAHSILYYIKKDDPLGDQPKKPEKDPQFELWESHILKWAEKEGYASSTPPTEKDNLHKKENKPTFEILTPTNNQAIITPLFMSRIKGSAPRGINRVEYYINNNMLASIQSYPFSLEKQINFLNNGFHNLKVRVCDDIDNCNEKNIEFNLILDNNNNVINKKLNSSWLEPSNGLAITNIDFPLNIKVSTENPSQTAKINIYLTSKEEASPQTQLISSLQPIENQVISGQWFKTPKSGTYKLLLETVGWDNKKTQGDEVIITVTNIRE